MPKLAADVSLLQARGVCVRYPGSLRDALRDVSLSIAHGECVAILGPSGSGKSTLVLALLGVIPHLVVGERRGLVHWPGHDPQPEIAAGAGVATFVQQDTDAQLVALSVEDELAFALENRGLPAALIDDRIAQWLSLPPMQGLQRDQSTLNLSSGWRQRLALGAALAEQASLLVLDEPTAHMDEGAAADAITTVAAARSAGTAVLLIDHRADLACGVASRVLVLDASGSPLASGPPAVVLAGLSDNPRAAGIRLPAVIVAAKALRSCGWLPKHAFVFDTSQLLAALGSRVEDPAVQSLVQNALQPRRRVKKSGGRSSPLISLSGVGLRRGASNVLVGIDISIHAGEIVGLAGPNGAGKTSLGLLAAGALTPANGIRAIGAARAPAFVPQNPTLAFATATLALEAQRRNLLWRDVAAALNLFGIEADPDRHPLRHSHGELRRIALAMAFASASAHLVILDEPTAGLDALGLDALQSAMETLVERQFGILAISHDLDFLGDIADRLVVLSQGRIIADGAIETMLERVAAGEFPLAAPPRAALARRFREMAGP